jgi:hypothetical protein
MGTYISPIYVEYDNLKAWVWIYKKNILDMDLLFKGDIWSLFFRYVVMSKFDILCMMLEEDLPSLLSFGFLAIQKKYIHTYFFESNVGLIPFINH